MFEPQLPIPAFNLLLALVHLRGSGTTKDFDAVFGFDKVEVPAQKALSKHEFVVIDRGVRPFAYELTDAGWRAARQLLSESLPKGASPRTARILWSLLRDFSAHMDRTGTELADIYPAQKEPEPEAEAERSVAESVRTAYVALAGDGSEWVPLRRLREQLGGIERKELDETLAELLGAHAIRLIPEQNQKTLTDADREAAVRIGGQHHHLIAIEAR